MPRPYQRALLSCSLRQWRRVISRRLAAESTLPRASGARLA
jgi:hypothetical protein